MAVKTEEAPPPPPPPRLTMSLSDTRLHRLVLGTRRRTAPRAWRHAAHTADAGLPVVVQTPWLYLPCAPRRVVRHGRNYSVHALLCRLWPAQDAEQRAWVHYLKRLRSSVLAWARRQPPPRGAGAWHWYDTLQGHGERGDACSAYTEVRAARTTADARANAAANTNDAADEGVTWQLTVPRLDTLSVFDADCRRSAADNLAADTHARFVVQVEHIWCNDASGLVGAHFRVLQAQHAALAIGANAACAFAPAPRRPALLGGPAQDDATTSIGGGDSSQARQNHPVYGGFFKMLAVGIPRICVEQKMRMQSLDPRVLATPPGVALPSPEASGSKGNPMMTEIMAARALRRVERGGEGEGGTGRGKPRFQRGFNHGISLSQIKDRLRSLRRVMRRRQDGACVGEGRSVSRERETPRPSSAPNETRGRGAASAIDASALLTLLTQKYQHRC